MNRNPNNAMFMVAWLLLTVPACKEKKQPPPESPPARQATEIPSNNPPTESKSPSEQDSLSEPPALPQSRPNQSPSVPNPDSTTESIESASASNPPSNTPSVPASPTMHSPPKLQTGSTDRDGDVSLVELAKSLTTAIDRAGRAFKAKDPDAALSEAIAARRSIPSPSTIAAMGKAAGPNGIIVAERIEAMRKKLDQALAKLDAAGAGVAPSVMKQDVVIQ